MQRKSYLLFVLLVALAALAFASIALADQVEDPMENWCYEGGPWGDGRCTVPGNGALTEWYWTCGYYRAQVVKGTFSASQIPQTCRAPVAPVAVSSSVPTTPTVTTTPPPSVTATLTFCTAFGEPQAGGTNLYISSAQLTDGATVSITANGNTYPGLTASASGGGFQITLPQWLASITGASITITGVGTGTLNDLNCNIEAPT
jgi:hypothetical protein